MYNVSVAGHLLAGQIDDTQEDLMEELDSIQKIELDIACDPHTKIQLTTRENIQELFELCKVFLGYHVPEKSRNYGKNFYVQVEDNDWAHEDTEDELQRKRRAIVRIRTRIANARDYRERIIKASPWNEKGQPQQDPTVRGPVFEQMMKVGADHLITESIQWSLYYVLSNPLVPKHLRPQKNLSLLGPRMLLRDRRIESGHEENSLQLAKYSPSIIPVVYFLRDRSRTLRPDYSEIQQVGFREKLFMRYADIHGKPKTYAKFLPAIAGYVGKRLWQKTLESVISRFAKQETEANFE